MSRVDEVEKLAKFIWETSQKDEGTISAIGAKIIANAIIEQFDVQNKLNLWAKRIHKCAADHGFWEEERNFGEMIALMHSELSEALESHRSGEEPVWFKEVDDPGCIICGRDNRNNTHDALEMLHLNHPFTPAPPKPEGAATELIDCIIRCLDTLYYMNVDIDEVMDKKISYNETRPYKHGRKY